MADIVIPELALVVLIGATGSGKSTFARMHFKPTEVISSDACRAMLVDDENDQSINSEAFDLVHSIAGKRLALRRLAVIDATSVQPEARKPIVNVAREHDVQAIAIVFNLPESLLQARRESRTDRPDMPAHVVHRQSRELRRSISRLEKEGFRRIYVLNSEEEVASARIVREKLWTDRRAETGPFDIIGDLHGCYDELIDLLAKLGYRVEEQGEQISVTPPPGRKALFVGDYVDRGPEPVRVLRLVMGMVAEGTAIALPGNHDVKLAKALHGRQVQRNHGLAETMIQMEAQPEAFRREVTRFIDGLVSHYVLDQGRLVVAHAGMKEEYAGRASGRVRDFALYGDTTGEIDEFGLPVRLNWAIDYRGQALVVYGHTPVPRPGWLNNTVNIDTGCCFGGSLTALRYPERELISVPARQQYAEPLKPFLDAPALLTDQQEQDELLDLGDLLGKRVIETALIPQVVIREENGIAALEVMARFAVNPKWLLYLPPTMSPVTTSQRSDLLEHPDQAFDYYQEEGVAQVVCEEKHMGSRAVLLICRDEETALRRFGVEGEGIGVCYTRTGRSFFDDNALEQALLARVRDAATAAGLWDSLETDWLCLDAELMPWSAKAQGLLQSMYAAVGAAAESSLGAAVTALNAAQAGGMEVADLHGRIAERANLIAQYRSAYRRYCWPVTTLDDYKIAPFHLLASEGAVHSNRDHLWHMQTLASLCAADPALLLATPYRVVDLADEASRAEAVAWWESLTASGGEGMVVKPMQFISEGPQGFAQPALKVRGREYLRIIYGPEYTRPDQIEKLRSRAVRRKRGMAAREFALGMEALRRFVAREPLRRVHECVFGVLALESEPIDPRL